MWRRKGFGFRSSVTKSGRKDMRFATGIRRSSAQRRGDRIRGSKTRARAAGKKSSGPWAYIILPSDKNLPAASASSDC